MFMALRRFEVGVGGVVGIRAQGVEPKEGGYMSNQRGVSQIRVPGGGVTQPGKCGINCPGYHLNY